MCAGSGLILSLQEQEKGKKKGRQTTIKQSIMQSLCCRALRATFQLGSLGFTTIQPTQTPPTPNPPTPSPPTPIHPTPTHPTPSPPTPTPPTPIPPTPTPNHQMSKQGNPNRGPSGLLHPSKLLSSSPPILSSHPLLPSSPTNSSSPPLNLSQDLVF